MAFQPKPYKRLDHPRSRCKAYAPNALPDFTLQQFLFRLFAIAVIGTGHGVAMAMTARLLGDEGPAHDGRMRVNPARHLDAIGTVCMLLWSVGWITPIQIDRARLRRSARDLVTIALAGLAAVMALAIALRLVAPLLVSLAPSSLGYGLRAWIDTVASLATWFVVANLVPLVPFTVGHVAVAQMPSLQEGVDRYGVVVRVVMAIVVATGVIARLLGGAQAQVMNLIP